MYMHYNRCYAFYVSVISFFKENTNSKCILTHLYAYADDDTLLLLAFKLIFVYFQHTFYS